MIGHRDTPGPSGTVRNDHRVFFERLICARCPSAAAGGVGCTPRQSCPVPQEPVYPEQGGTDANAAEAAGASSQDLTCWRRLHRMRLTAERGSADGAVRNRRRESTPAVMPVSPTAPDMNTPHDMQETHSRHGRLRRSRTRRRQRQHRPSPCPQAKQRARQPKRRCRRASAWTGRTPPAGQIARDYDVRSVASARGGDA